MKKTNNSMAKVYVKRAIKKEDGFPHGWNIYLDKEEMATMMYYNVESKLFGDHNGQKDPEVCKFTHWLEETSESEYLREIFPQDEITEMDFEREIREVVNPVYQSVGFDKAGGKRCFALAQRMVVKSVEGHKNEWYKKLIKKLEAIKKNDLRLVDYIEEVTNKIKPQQMENEKKGGFFDLPKMDICNDPSHNPPQHLYIPPGQGYRHVCPRCGKEQTIIPQQTSF